MFLLFCDWFCKGCWKRILEKYSCVVQRMVLPGLVDEGLREYGCTYGSVNSFARLAESGYENMVVWFRVVWFCQGWWKRRAIGEWLCNSVNGFVRVAGIDASRIWLYGSVNGCARGWWWRRCAIGAWLCDSVSGFARVAVIDPSRIWLYGSVNGFARGWWWRREMVMWMDLVVNHSPREIFGPSFTPPPPLPLSLG